MLSARRTAGSANGPSSAAAKARPNSPGDGIEVQPVAGQAGGAGDRQVAHGTARHQIGLVLDESGDGEPRSLAAQEDVGRLALAGFLVLRHWRGEAHLAVAFGGDDDSGPVPTPRSMIAISGWASSCRKFGRGPCRLISSTWSVIATTSSMAPSTGFSGLRLARLAAARNRVATWSAVTGLPSAHCARRIRKV